MEQKQKPRQRSIIRQGLAAVREALVPGWRPTQRQVVVIIRIVVALIAIVLIMTVVSRAYEMTLRNWLELLIVPAVLAGGGVWFNWAQKQREQAIEVQRAQDTALQAYLDHMAQLLIDQPLRRSQPGDDLSVVARARTLTVLGRLDGHRKSSVLQFLRESGLIEKEQPVIDLKGADLSGTNLRSADLSGANLSGADLDNADLFGSNLRDADLSGVHLRNANLTFADLRGTNLTLAQLTDAVLTFAHLNDIDLSGTYLIDANLSGAYLVDANLSGTNFTFANLSNADLTFADLGEADLSGADLTYANLTGAKVTDDQLIVCRSLKGATMPDGSQQ